MNKKLKAFANFIERINVRDMLIYSSAEDATNWGDNCAFVALPVTVLIDKPKSNKLDKPKSNKLQKTAKEKLRDKVFQLGRSCSKCATKAGGVWPKGHCATVTRGNCGICGKKAHLVPTSDYQWNGKVWNWD